MVDQEQIENWDAGETKPRCSDCAHCRDFGSEGLRCQWEKRHLPPPVFRARLWGKDAPRTQNAWAEDCKQFERHAR